MPTLLGEKLDEMGFGETVRELCAPYYESEDLGCPPVDPEVFFKMFMVGFFEGIGSERGIASRCDDSLSIRRFLRYDLTESTPDHSTPPKTRRTSGAMIAGYANMAQSAIALLLHQPDIARLADPKQLDDLEGDDMGLLRELLILLHRRPESNTAMLLGHWYGTAEGKLLSRLAGQERLIPTAGIEQQFVDTMGELAQLPHRSKLSAQVDKLKLTNYAEVSETEKQQLREMLQAKQRRDAQRNKRKD